jgi:hypothetical protein
VVLKKKTSKLGKKNEEVSKRNYMTDSIGSICIKTECEGTGCTCACKACEAKDE